MPAAPPQHQRAPIAAQHRTRERKADKTPHPFQGRKGSAIRDRFAATLYAEQHGACAMCGTTINPTLRGTSDRRAAVVDHKQPHRLRPDLEKRDCDICRRYDHHGWRNPDETKRGKPILDAAGGFIPRSRRNPPECVFCPVVFRWSDENAGLYARYRMHRLGIDTGEIEPRTAWSFFRLAEAEDELELERRAVCPLTE